MRIEHSGTSVLWDGERWVYFAQGPGDEPRSWGFVIARTRTTGADGKPVIDQQTTAEEPTTAQAAILSRLLTRGTSTGSTGALKFSEYEPGFYGPLTITLDPDDRRPWDPDALAALTEVVLTFDYTHT
jgi:hypothetical protein